MYREIFNSQKAICVKSVTDNRLVFLHGISSHKANFNEFFFLKKHRTNLSKSGPTMTPAPSALPSVYLSDTTLLLIVTAKTAEHSVIGKKFSFAKFESQNFLS